MSQLLFLVAVAALVIGAFWFSLRLAMKAGVNVPFPSSPPPAPEGPATEELRALPLVGLSVRTLLQNPGLLCFAAATALVSAAGFWLVPSELKSWLVSGQPFSTAAISSLTTPRALTGQIVSGVFDSFAYTWVRVGVALAVLPILRGGGWSFGEVLGRLRARWKPVFVFAVLVILAELPGQIAGDLAPNHPLLSFASLLLGAVPFFLGFGAAILAHESANGVATARRSIDLVFRIWPTRFWGHLLIRSPLMAIPMTTSIVAFVQGYSGNALTLPAASSALWSVNLMMIASVPLATVGAIFDAALYLRSQQQSSAAHPGPPPGLRPGEGVKLLPPRIFAGGD